MPTSVTPGLRETLRQDALVALVVAVLLLVGSAVVWPEDVWTQLPRIGKSLMPPPSVTALLLLESIPLTFRRIAPVPVFGVCVAASLALPATGEPTPLPLGVLVAVYTVAVRLRPLVSVAAAGVYVGLLALGVVTGVSPIDDDLFYDYLISLIATVMLGYGIALGQARAEVAERSARELARDRDAHTEAAVAQEQARIAREVHDIVAHDVSVIVAQAAAARRLIPSEEAPAHTLQAIEAAGREALDGLRRLMHLVRSDAGETLRSPQPTLDRLPALVEQVHEAGLPVELEVRGRARRLPATVETNAYRIVQEALTNALKHAGPARARVVLDYRPDELRIDVHDDGHGSVPAAAPADPAPASGGFGLVSMRQRAALLDGQVDVGPDDDGGFRVSARLPVGRG
jgi:signal transduction histidine kinase